MAIDKAVDSTKLDNALEYTADRIRAKSGESADIAFDFATGKGFGNAIDNLPSGGGSGMIAPFAYQSSKITSFASDASGVLDNAFAWCDKMTTVSLPMASYIGTGAFYTCVRLTTVSLPSASYIGANAFHGCDSLTTISLPMASYIEASAFQSCVRLTTVSLPMVSYIGKAAFEYCFSLATVSLPMARYLSDEAFEYCSHLTTVSLPMTYYIGRSVFKACYNLISLYVLDISVCTLSASNAFSSTPIGGYSASAGQYGSIYVPASLLASYQSKTNWSYFSSRMVGV